MTTPKQYARMICDYLKKLPDHYADDPKAVQAALGLSDEAFKQGVDWCIARKIIALDAQSEVKSPVSQVFTAESQGDPMKSTAELAVAMA